jgi:hypothetical protein
VDCDNQDAEVNPGLAEACEGKDSDCDGLRDEDCATLQPVLELHFDGDISDFSPNEMPARWEEGVGSFSEGQAGQAASFAGGSSPFVFIDDDPRLRGMGLFTLSVWARKNSADGGGSIVLKHVYYALGVSGDTVDAYLQTTDGAIDLDAYHYAPVADTDWHHYLMTYDSRTGQAQLLVDDEVAASGSGTGFVRDEPCDPRDLYIGKNPWGASFDGSIDELIIYDGLF